MSEQATVGPTAGSLVHERILILAPTGRDAELSTSILGKSGFNAVACSTLDDLTAEIEKGCGTVIITEETLTTAAMRRLSQSLDRQPPWSDIPLLIFTSQPSAELAVLSFEQLGARANVTLIERPIRVKTMISAVNAALRARRRQYEVRDLVDQLERRVAERDHFLAMLSHELRNPLAAIMLAIDGRNGDGEESIVARQTRHLGKLVDDLLDIARVTTGKIVLHKTNIDISDIVEHCVETARARAEERRLTLTLSSSGDHAHVHGDAVRLEQVVTNLLSNAIKYTPSGGNIECGVEVDGNEVIVRVRDSGKGIAPEMLTRIFDMFMQGETTIDRSEGGMGIGLTLVKKLIELHDGSVRAYSRGRGSGSEFVVRLPLSKRANASAPKPAAKTVQSPLSLVVVEDNSDIRYLLHAKLKQLGHSVEAAEDGPKGLERILQMTPDAALVDIGLPGIDGYEVARRVREAVGDSVYLIALTGYGQAEDKKKAVEAGFNVHLTKPADFVDLQNVLGAVVSRTQ